MITRDQFKYTEWIEAHVSGFRSDILNNRISYTPVMKHKSYLGRGNVFYKQNINRFVKAGGDRDEVLRIQAEQPLSVYPDDWQGFVIKAYDQTDVDLNNFPTCKQAIDLFGNDCMNVVYARLSSNTHIPTHIDRENINGDLIAVHLPLFMEEGSSYLKYEQEVLPLEVGKVTILQTELLHSSHNISNTIDRVNVIFVFRKENVIL